MKNIKNILLIIVLLFIISGCKKNNEPVHVHTWVEATCELPKKCTTCHKIEGEKAEHQFEWVVPENVKCNSNYIALNKCIKCGIVSEEEERFNDHKYIENITVESTCLEDGEKITTCEKCDYYKTEVLKANGHEVYYDVLREPMNGECGYRVKCCKNCSFSGDSVAFVNNGFAHNGKLSVNGADLVNQYGEKFQLVGLSTHGLQWAHRFVNYDTFEALRNSFGINVVRLSLYPNEGGYCTSDEKTKEFLYQTLANGIRIATELDMYVIIDWHMLGVGVPGSENPLYYLTEALQFFKRVTEEFKEYDNLLFDIMNEPSGDTTWKDCKEYANKVIPVIRENSDGIILVGNPKWSSDLNSVMGSPLTGYEDIMYTYHFYAGDRTSPVLLKRAYNAGIPVFVSEHGGMENTGDGPLYYDYIQLWWQELDKLNISYVAWNISNTGGSASIFKHGTTDIVDVSNSNLKEWGVYYRNHLRERLGLPEYR